MYILSRWCACIFFISYYTHMKHTLCGPEQMTASRRRRRSCTKMSRWYINAIAARRRIPIRYAYTYTLYRCRTCRTLVACDTSVTRNSSFSRLDIYYYTRPRRKSVAPTVSRCHFLLPLSIYLSLYISLSPDSYRPTNKTNSRRPGCSIHTRTRHTTTQCTHNSILFRYIYHARDFCN